MGDCDAAVTVTMAACRRCKQRINNINQLALVLGLLHVEDAIESREHTSIACSLCNVRLYSSHVFGADYMFIEKLERAYTF